MTNDEFRKTVENLIRLWQSVADTKVPAFWNVVKIVNKEATLQRERLSRVLPTIADPANGPADWQEELEADLEASRLAAKDCRSRLRNANASDPDKESLKAIGKMVDRLIEISVTTDDLLSELKDDSPPDDDKLGGIKTTIDEVAAYPILTVDGSGRGTTASGSAAGQSLGLVARRAMGSVLGIMPRTDDPSAFVAALNANFATREFEGRTVIDYQPRGSVGSSTAGTVVSGAQASIYHRAKDILDDALLLIARIRPLRLVPDEDDIAMSRNLITDMLKQLVDELGNDGGPRRQRLDVIFEFLTDHPFKDAAGNDCSKEDPFGCGEVGRLAGLLGLGDGEPETVADEQNIEDYHGFIEYLKGLRQACAKFDDKGSAFFGIQLSRLTREMAAVSDSVEEAQYAMDSVYLGQMERKTAVIKFAGGPMTIQDFLSWITDSTQGESAGALQSGDRYGIRSMRGNIGKLDSLMQEWLTLPNPPAGIGHPRVQKALQDLQRRLSSASALLKTI